MSGVWSSILALDLTIPSNGSLTPGSGSIYIGGPQLPSTLQPDIKYALIFYTDAVGLAQGVDYWFIAHFSNAGAGIDGLEFGYYPTGGPAVFTNWKQFFLGNTDQVFIEAAGTIFVQSRSAIQGAIRLRTDGSVIVLNQANVSGIEIQTGTTPSIKGYNTPTIDQWLSSSTTQTATCSGGAGFTNTGVTLRWRNTIDRMVDLRGVIAFGGFPPVSQYIGVNIPNVLPPYDVFDGSVGPIMAGFMWRSDFTHFVPITLRLDGTTNNHLTIFGSTSNGADDTVQFSGTYSTTKP